jgi:hypothetical protein
MTLLVLLSLLLRWTVYAVGAYALAKLSSAFLAHLAFTIWRMQL